MASDSVGVNSSNDGDDDALEVVAGVVGVPKYDGLTGVTAKLSMLLLVGSLLGRVSDMTAGTSTERTAPWMLVADGSSWPGN